MADMEKSGENGQGATRTALFPTHISVYYVLRISLHKKRWLLRFVQVIRGWWILGPLRQYAIRYHQKFSNNQPIHVDDRELFPTLNVDHIVEAMNERGYANGVRLPADYVAQIVEYCADTGRLRSWNPHKECAPIDWLARNAKIVEIARRYLGAEPILWLTQLKWSFGDINEQQTMLPSLHAEPLQHDDDAFHYDTLDFKSLTMFVYLTDVDAASGPHVVIEGTHKRKRLAELGRIILSDTTAQEKFGDRIKVILGQKGTVLFEETSCYHKAALCEKKRLMLSIDYVLQRTPPPDRLPSPSRDHDRRYGS